MALSYWEEGLKLTINAPMGYFLEVVKCSNKKTYLRLFNGGKWWYYPMRDRNNLKQYPIGRYSKVLLSAIMYRPSWVVWGDPFFSFIF